MTSRDFLGVSLESFEDPIHYALGKYRNISNGDVAFDREAAMALDVTPDKPNFARSKSGVRFKDEIIGELFIIAFRPFNATGAESEKIKLADINTTRYPRDTKFLPRPKVDVHSEVMLSIASHNADSPSSEPICFANSMELLGLSDDKVTKIADLGTTHEKLRAHVASGQQAQPLATYTVGYHHDYNALNADGERYGDPHAVFNPFSNIVQVCGFIAIKSESPQHIDALRALDAVEPNFL